jgi:Na+(H+)/acetate symporter ActP
VSVIDISHDGILQLGDSRFGSDLVVLGTPEIAGLPYVISGMVTAAFSIAASALLPALVLGIFWSRANKWGALRGIASGLGLSLYYLIHNEPWLRAAFGVTAPIDLWFDILPVSAGVFGVPLGIGESRLWCWSASRPLCLQREPCAS